MFKKAAFIATGVLTLAAMASPALAQSFSPGTATGFTGSGSVRLRQSQTINCNVGLTTAAFSAGATSVAIPTRSISPGDLLCLAASPYGAWSGAVVPGSTTQISLTIGANTILNQPCYDTIIVAWNNATSTATFNNNVLDPVNPAHAQCTVILGSVTIPGLKIIP